MNSASLSPDTTSIMGRDIEARIRPVELGGDMGTVAVTNELLSLI